MYQEEIAVETARHLRTHIGAYLEAISAIKQDGVKLVQPNAIETENLAGGVFSTKVENLPAYAVDILEKEFVAVQENLWLYQYRGHIAGMIAAPDESAANKIVKRNEQAVEKFVREHNLMHEFETTSFTFREMGFAGAAFSGAEMVGEANDRQTWIAGFRVDVVWVTSEDGPSQHAET